MNQLKEKVSKIYSKVNGQFFANAGPNAPGARNLRKPLYLSLNVVHQFQAKVEPS